ncbi:MAG: hypothetical protein COA32_10955 [Fluviicola sp.]|nr:MAG: hypothetical protein COA32_10955 [Fluviicola sp.]
MKTLLILVTLICISFGGISQDCNSLTMIQEGSKWELTNYNKKDKVQGSTVYHVTKVASQGDGVKWTIEMDMKDDKGEVYSESTTDISCEAGVFKMSMENFMNNEQMQGLQDMDVEVDASNIEYPTEPKIGETLPDASINIKVSTNGMTMMNMTTTITDRKVEKKETIETPAGSFDCLIVTQKTTIANKLLNKEYPSKDWYVPGFGVVRSESYKSNGKLMGYSLLTMYQK